MSSMDSHNRFFLIILKEMVRDDKISLPAKTVRTFGVKIPNRVVFKLPDSLQWQIEVIKLKEMVWFHRGWREFADYYGLDYGSLLTFKFDGESAFKVCIFDKTANEIDYPCAVQKTSKNTEFKERDSIKLERDLLVETRGKPSLSDPRPLKKVKPEDPWTGAAEFRGGPKSWQNPRKHVTQTPFFEICICSSTILQASLHIPQKFANKYLARKDIEKVTLKVGDRRWVVRVKKYNNAVKLIGGWRSFARDNALHIRDVCIFELVVGDTFEFQVSILRYDP